jgi:hypothetical protein
LVGAFLTLKEVFRLENKIGSKGQYGGIVTEMNTLEVGTKFFVENGYWEGKIVLKNGNKAIHIKNVRTFEIPENYLLEISIEGIEANDN